MIFIGVYMPTASNVTINDGSITPVATLFTMIQPSGGNLPATYIAKSKGPMMAAQPKIMISASGTAKTRESKITIKTPYWVTGADSVTKVVDSVFTEIRTVLPDSIPDAVRKDHQAYVANFCDAAQVQETMRDGYAPS